MNLPNRIIIENFELDVASGELLEGKNRSHLAPKAVEVLVFLASHPAQLVSREQLHEKVWAGRIVTDVQISKAINEIRVALRDTSEPHRIIETLPRRGYRFITTAIIEPSSDSEQSTKPGKSTRTHYAVAGVLLILLVLYLGVPLLNPVTEPKIDPPRQQSSTLQAIPLTSIAVLPFANMSSDPEQEFFSDGLSEDILNGLAKFSDIKVIARSSSFQFKGNNQDVRKIGELLNVAHVLEGSVRKVGSKIRVTAQLVSTTDGAHIWSEQYNRELTDVFAVQDEITAAILEVLNIHFAPLAMNPTPTTTIEAYNAFLIGRYHLHRFEFDKAIESFELATRLDPEFALPYAGLAGVYSSNVGFMQITPSEGNPIINTFLEKALSRDPTQLTALMGKATRHFYIDRNYQAAIDEIHLLLKRFPNTTFLMSGYAAVLQSIGKPDMAVQLLQRVVELDPLSPSAYYSLSQTYYFTGRYEEAKLAAMQSERLGLDNAITLYIIALVTDDYEAVQTQLDRGATEWGNGRFFLDIYRAFFAYSKDEKEQVAQLLSKIEQSPIAQHRFAKFNINMLKGDLNAALDGLDVMLEESEPLMMRDAREVFSRQLFNLWPQYKSNARYLEILKKAGLDDESVADLVIPPLPF